MRRRRQRAPVAGEETAAARAERFRRLDGAVGIGATPPYDDPEPGPTHEEALVAVDSQCPYRCAGDPRRSRWFEARGLNDPRATRCVAGWPRRGLYPWA